MNFKRIEDFTTKTWYVDYKDECGFDTYGPDTHEGCTKFIQHNNARTSAGEKFDVGRGPYQKEPSNVTHMSDARVTDGYHEDIAAESTIDSNKVIDLYRYGEITVKVPSDMQAADFASACISWIQDLWGEPEVNFYYDEVEFGYNVNEDNTVTIFIVK